MKKISLYLTACIALLSFTACQTDDDIVFVVADASEVAFTNDFLSEYILTTATANNIGERFTWNAVDFGVPTNVSYELQNSISGDFTDATPVANTSGHEIAITIGQMRTLAIASGLDDDPDTENPNTGPLFFRLKASVGTAGGEERFSAVQSLTVVLPETEEEPIVQFRDLFLVGNATAADWDNNNNNQPITRHPDNENLYSFTGRFLGTPNQFKLLEIKGQWQPQWGLSNGQLISSDELGGDPDPFDVPGSDGYYSIEVDIDNASFSITAFDESGAITYGTIGIIGDSTPNGWDSSTAMTQSTFDPHIWYINGIELVDGEMKFRADDDWAVNWGANTPISGFCDFDGPNIPVSAGTYDIWFNDLDGGFIFLKLD